MTPGKVWLVGAGPGDPELLTLKAVRVLGTADVVLVDDLVDRAVLAHVPASARIVEVGKRGGCKSTPQAFIERLMVQEARAGHCVVRLKGGDPFVFGRGGEEMLAARAAGIPVEVVHGVTSGIAAPACLGIPVTHRDATHGVAFVTGHTGKGDEPDWAALAKSGLTLVIYMGVANAPRIVSSLLAAGLAVDLPAAVIERATTPDERAIATTLGGLVGDMAAAGSGSPAILVIGAVAALAEPSALAAQALGNADFGRAAHTATGA